MCGLGMSTPKGCGQERTEGMQEARGGQGDTANTEVEGMLTVVENAQGNNGRGGWRGGR